jgi:hypothetical protein
MTIVVVGHHYGTMNVYEKNKHKIRGHVMSSVPLSAKFIV